MLNHPRDRHLPRTHVHDVRRRPPLRSALRRSAPRGVPERRVRVGHPQPSRPVHDWRPVRRPSVERTQGQGQQGEPRMISVRTTVTTTAVKLILTCGCI